MVVAGGIGENSTIFGLEAPAVLPDSVPEHSKTKGSLGAIVRGVDAIFKQKDPKATHLGIQHSGEPSRLILASFVKVDEMTHSSETRNALLTTGEPSE